MIGDAIRRWLENTIRNWLTTIFEEDAIASLPALDILTSGRLELHGLKLRAGLLPVGLPVQLQQAHVSKLTFTVSLLKLRVRVSVDGVMVQMRLHEPPTNIADAVERVGAAHVEAVEQALEEAAARLNGGSSASSSSGGSSSGSKQQQGGGGGGGGLLDYLLSRVISRVINNVEVKLSNVRCELITPPPNASKPVRQLPATSAVRLAAARFDRRASSAAAGSGRRYDWRMGVQLGSARLTGTNMRWRRALNKQGGVVTRKALEIEGLGVYCEPILPLPAPSAPSAAPAAPTAAAAAVFDLDASLFRSDLAEGEPPEVEAEGFDPDVGDATDGGGGSGDEPSSGDDDDDDDEVEDDDDDDDAGVAAAPYAAAPGAARSRARTRARRASSAANGGGGRSAQKGSTSHADDDAGLPARAPPCEQPAQTGEWWTAVATGSAAAPAASSSPSHSSDASTEEHRWLLAPINVSARARIDLSLFFPHHHQHARPGGAAASEARPRRFTRDLHTDHPRPRFLCLDVSLSPVLAAIDEAQLTAIIGAVATAEQASALSLEAAEMAAADRRLPNPAAQREYVHLTRALLFEEETRQASRQARDTAAARDGGDGGREHDGEHGDGEMRDPAAATTAPAAAHTTRMITATLCTAKWRRQHHSRQR